MGEVLSRRLSIQSGEEVGDRDATLGDHLGRGAVQCADEWCSPAILVDDDRCGMTGFENACGFGEIVVADQPGGSLGEQRDVDVAVESELGDVDRHHFLGVSPHECEIEDGDDVSVDEVSQMRESRAVKAGVGGKFDDEIVDRTEWHVIGGHHPRLAPKPTGIITPSG